MNSMVAHEIAIELLGSVTDSGLIGNGSVISDCRGGAAREQTEIVGDFP